MSADDLHARVRTLLERHDPVDTDPHEFLGARFDAGSWEHQLTLGLVGAFLQLGWPKVLGASESSPAVRAREQAELAWWSERLLEGARLLRARA